MLTIIALDLNHRHWHQACERMGAQCNYFTLTCDATLSNGKCITVDIDKDTPILGELIGALCHDAASGLENVHDKNIVDMLIDEFGNDFVGRHLDNFGELNQDAPEELKDAYQTRMNELADWHMESYSTFILDGEPVLAKYVKRA